MFTPGQIKIYAQKLNLRQSLKYSFISNGFNTFSKIIQKHYFAVSMSAVTINNERQLFQQIAVSDTEAFRQIFDLYKNAIFSTAIRLTKSQLKSEEITQQVFISLWVSRGRLSDVTDPGAYIFRILYNEISSYLKKESHRERIIKDAMQFRSISLNATQEAIDANESRRRINEAVENLPPQQKAVYKLSRQDGLNNEQIAAVLKISPHTVKSHLSKALESLRAQLKDLAFVTALLATFKF